jgi:hypothetical protein
MVGDRFFPPIEPVVAAAAVLLALAVTPVAGQQIVKCQDAEGRWHYGQFAAEACETGAVRIDERGVRRGAVPTEPSPAEREAQRQVEALAEEEAQRLAAQRESDQRLLRIYESEDQIIRARDERLEAVDGEIAVSEEFLQRLDARMADLEREHESPGLSESAREAVEADMDHTRGQVGRFRDAIAASLSQRRDIEQRYADDLERFREIMERRSADRNPAE